MTNEVQKDVLGQKDVAELFGHSVNWFKNNLRFTKKFMQNVPNKTPNAIRPTYLRHDVERFKEYSLKRSTS